MTTVRVLALIAVAVLICSPALAGERTDAAQTTDVVVSKVKVNSTTFVTDEVSEARAVVGRVGIADLRLGVATDRVAATDVVAGVETIGRGGRVIGRRQYLGLRRAELPVSPTIP